MVALLAVQNLKVTNMAPSSPIETTTTSHLSLAISLRATSFISCTKSLLLPKRALNSPKLGLIKYTPASTACFKASPLVSTIDLAFATAIADISENMESGTPVLNYRSQLYIGDLQFVEDNVKNAAIHLQLIESSACQNDIVYDWTHLQ